MMSDEYSVFCIRRFKSTSSTNSRGSIEAPAAASIAESPAV
jgi:hypothetical protein